MKTADAEIPIKLFSVCQVASALQVREAKIRDDLRSGALRGSRVGRLWRIRAEEIERYLEACVPTSPPEPRAPRTGAARGGRPRTNKAS